MESAKEVGAGLRVHGCGVEGARFMSEEGEVVEIVEGERVGIVDAGALIVATVVVDVWG
jgi:hypothetical protein